MVAGLMVTSGEGKPVEFHVASKVKATALQAALYGETLDAFLKREIVATPLLEQLESPPELVLANSRDVVGTPGSCPVVSLAAADDHPHNAATGAELLTVATPGADSALALEVAPDDVDWVQTLLPLLGEAGTKFDLLATFDRIETALGVLGEKDARYQ